MKSDLKVEFPAPCSESWEEMTNQGCSRHCTTCDTNVHDLSLLTTDETERMLDSGEKLCVRAEVDPEGRIKTADGAHPNARILFACAGASLSLLAAACQTTPGGQIADGHNISGVAPRYPYVVRAEIVSENGESAGLHIGQDRRFDVHKLRPGTYRLSFTDSCGDVFEVKGVVVADGDVDLGQLQWEAQCIIIGQMKRAGVRANI